MPFARGGALPRAIPGVSSRSRAGFPRHLAAALRLGTAARRSRFFERARPHARRSNVCRAGRARSASPAASRAPKMAARALRVPPYLELVDELGHQAEV